MKPSFSSGFLALDHLKAPKLYQKKFTDQEVGSLVDRNAKGEVVASLDYMVKDFFLNETSPPLKLLLIANMRSEDTREAYLSWSDRLSSEVIRVKKKTKASYVLFLLSRRMKGSFRHIVRPNIVRSHMARSRKKHKDPQLRFNHLRSVNIEMIQGRHFFHPPPLKYVEIRRATAQDAHAISGYIKRAGRASDIKRLVSREILSKEMDALGHKDFSNLALALSHNKRIVGILGSYNPEEHLKAVLDLDEIKDSIFFATQTFLKVGSIFKKDLRPVFNKKPLNFRFFTHIYCNNKDIFYSLVHWWLDESFLTKPVFLYPHYKGELKTAPPASVFSSGFSADLYLMQDPKAPPSPLLKPTQFFTSHMDIDLPLLF